MRLSIDFETRSTVDLLKAGVDRYAEDSTTGIWCLAWKLPKHPPRTWRIGQPDPADLLRLIADGAELAAWNAPFEAAIFHYVVRRLYPHWPQPRLEQWDCTMARALAMALPGSLERCAEALKLPVQKDKAGHRLMMRMCKPTPTWKKWNDGGRVGSEPVMWHNNLKDLDYLADRYCPTDTIVEEAIGDRIAPLTPAERANWLLNERVNRRGIRLDLPKIAPALDVVTMETKRLNKELRTITDGAVTGVTKVKDTLTWLTDNVFTLPDLKKRTVETALAQRIERADIRRVLEIRKEAGRASVAKLRSMLACVNGDGRARGLLGYHTATTGRAASRRIQVQNMIRAFLKAHEINQVLALLAADADLDFIADAIRLGYADPIAAIASCLRSLIIPSRGRVLIGGDYSNIEGRITAWLAGEDWKLNAFRDFDAGQGIDLYILAYARSFGINPKTIKKDDPRRQVGKVQELSCGFSGGPFALLNMCLLYGQNVTDLADAVRAITGFREWEYASERFPQDLAKQRGLSKHAWTGLKVIVNAWREAHPMVKAFWYDLERCAVDAVREPGKVFAIQSGLIKWCSNGHFLRAQLPSGRCLAYANPHLRWFRRSDGAEMPVKFRPSQEDMYAVPRPYRQSLKYWGQGKVSKKWEARKAWHGLLVENVVQGTARDILFFGMHRAEDSGYPIILHVHDEMVSEVGHNFGSKEEFRRIMCTPEPWMAGLPISASTFRSERYGKE
jgi:DNA polymerase